jgi:phasin family protein
MADQNNNGTAKAAAEAPAKIAETTAATAEKVVAESAKTAKRARATAARRASRRANAASAPKKATARKATKTTARATTRSAKTNQRKAANSAPRTERIQDVNPTNFFAGFNAVPAMAPFQSMFANVGDRSQEAARRSQQVTENFADLARGNVEALVEASRVAAEGARSIGQDVIAKGREGVEEAAGAIRTLAEAKSPTEFVQLQSEIARASFDRMVAESSRLTESMVKLAGEAIQPLSNRATANAERINNFVA